MHRRLAATQAVRRRVAAAAPGCDAVVCAGADVDGFEADMGPDAGSSVTGVWRLLATLAVCAAVLAVGLFLTWGQVQPRLQALAGHQPVSIPTRRHAPLLGGK